MCGLYATQAGRRDELSNGEGRGGARNGGVGALGDGADGSVSLLKVGRPIRIVASREQSVG